MLVYLPVAYRAYYEKKRHHKCFGALRLDNTGAWVFEVNPSLRCDWMCDNVELYIKLKL